MSRKTPEGYVKAAVMEYLAVEGISAYRMNAGSMCGETKGKKWRVQMCEPGTADILALVGRGRWFMPLWVECKAPKGKQSEAQREFERKVKAEGQCYVVAYGIEDVREAIKRI